MKRLLLLVMLLPAVAWGQTAYDAVSHVRQGWGDNLSTSHTVTSSSDRYLGVVVATAGSVNPTSVTIGSTELSLRGSYTTGGIRTFYYDSTGVASGAHTITASFGTYGQYDMTVWSASNVSQSSPRRGLSFAAYTGPSFGTDMTTSAGDLVLDHAYCEYDGSETPGTGQTQIHDQLGYAYAWASRESSTTSTTTMSWTIGSGAYTFVHTVVSLKPATGGADLDPMAFHGWPVTVGGGTRFANEDTVWWHGIRLTDDNGLDSAWFYLETTAGSGTYTLTDSWAFSPTRTDSTVRTYNSRSTVSVGRHRWYVKVRDGADSVAYSDTMMVSVLDQIPARKRFLWYAQGWRMNSWANMNEFHVDSLDLYGVDFLVWFWGSNIDTVTSADFARWKPLYSDYGSYPYNVSDSVNYEYNTNSGSAATYANSIYNLRTRATNAGTKLLASVGDIPGCEWKWMIADSTRLQSFVDHVVEWVKRKDWDGIDINVENTGCGWGDTASTNRAFKFFRKALDKASIAENRQLHLTAVPIVHPVTALGRIGIHYLDYVIPQGQVYHNSSYLEGVSNVLSPMAPLDTVAVPSGVFAAHQLVWGPTAWYDYGTPKDRILFLLPTYGYKWGHQDTVYRVIPWDGSGTDTIATHGTPFAREIIWLSQGADTTGRDTTWKNSFARGTYNHPDAAYDTIGADFWGGMYTVPNQRFFASWIDSTSMAEIARYWLDWGIGGFSLYGAEEDMRDKYFNANAPGSTAWYLKDALEVELDATGEWGDAPQAAPSRKFILIRRP